MENPKKIELTQLQKEVLIFMGKSDFGKNFYWTGGTLLSYFYLSHRFSVDLDFFSDDLYRNELYNEFIGKLKKDLKIDNISETLKENRRLYILQKGKENVKLEFVFYPFSAIEKRDKVKEFLVKADSLIDIITNKTLSIYQRNEVKDLYDLYWYLQNNSKDNLQKLVELVEKKFGMQIDITLLLAKINKLADNFDDLKPVLFDYKKEMSKEIKNFFQQEFNKIAKKNIK